MLLTGAQPILRVLKDDAVPHLFAWSQSGTGAVASRNRMHSAQKRKSRQQQQQREADEACLNVQYEETVESSMDIPHGKENCRITNITTPQGTGSASGVESLG